jgi:hypothetical protein
VIVLSTPCLTLKIALLRLKIVSSTQGRLLCWHVLADHVSFVSGLAWTYPVFVLKQHDRLADRRKSIGLTRTSMSTGIKSNLAKESSSTVRAQYFDRNDSD